MIAFGDHPVVQRHRDTVEDLGGAELGDGTRESERGSASEGLPQGEVKLETADALIGRRSQVSEQFFGGALESEKARRIHTIGQIQPQWTDGCAIAEADAHGVHHVIEVLPVTLKRAEGKSDTLE